MPDTQHCPKCMAEVPREALFGLCDNCLYDVAAESVQNEPTAPVIAFGKGARQFADYKLGRQLGRGGMGVVYEAIQMSLHRRVALKMILDVHTDSPAVRRRFAIEAEAAAKLDHPNIVPIYEVGEMDDQPFLSMKLVEGESLKERMARGDICVPARGGPTNRTDVHTREMAVARLTTTIARAVHHAHQRGVLHRDLKPGNILLDPQGEPHLTDFGLAKITDRTQESTATSPLTVVGSAMGTPSYMSPEQASGCPLTAATDIYSLGAVLYEMLTGQPPFRASTPLETLRMVTDQQARRPSALVHLIDRDLETVCLKCLERNPSSRYGTALDLAEDLERWMRQEPIRARPAGTLKRLTQWGKRNPLAAGLIVSLCLGLCLALALLDIVNKRWKAEEMIAGAHTFTVTQAVGDLWLDETRSFVSIAAADLAAIARLTPRDPSVPRLSLIYAVRINAAPIPQAEGYAHLLRTLEDRMGSILGRPVSFDLRLYRMSLGPEQPVVRGDADFQRMGVVSYLRAKLTTPAIKPVAREVTDRDGVIYAPRQIGILNLEQVKGHRAAFAHTNSTVSFLAKVWLARAGVCAASLSFHTNLGYVNPMPALVSATAKETGSREADMDAEGLAHKNVFREIVNGRCDVGVIQGRYFEGFRYKHNGLIELHRFKVPGDVIVAREGLPQDVVNVFQSALVSMRSKADRKILGRLQNSLIKGFEGVSDKDYEELRSMLFNEMRYFDTGAPSLAHP